MMPLLGLQSYQHKVVAIDNFIGLNTTIMQNAGSSRIMHCFEIKGLNFCYLILLIIIYPTFHLKWQENRMRPLLQIWYLHPQQFNTNQNGYRNIKNRGYL